MSKQPTAVPAPPTTITTPEVTYSEAEAAARLGISKPSLLRLRKEARIGHYRIGARVVYSEDKHIRPFLDSCHQPPGGTDSGKAGSKAEG
jgi:excisionase family DNA binding protein